MSNISQSFIIFSAILVWYASSAVANTSSRKCLNTVPAPLLLTFIQFLFTTLFLKIYLLIFPSKLSTTVDLSLTKIFKSKSYNTSSSSSSSSSYDNTVKRLFLKLSAVYTIGFIFVNAGYVLVNVSLAETLRSAEPIVSVILAKLWLKHEKVSTLILLSMIPIALGGGLSSFGDNSFSLLGLFFVTVSNFSFSLRSLFTKRLKEEGYQADAIEIFYHVSKVGLFYLFFLISSREVFAQVLYMEEMKLSNKLHLLDQPLISTLGLNAICYFLYNQMSFFVLSKVSMVTHGVANALRRIVTILASVWYFKNNINNVNAVGIFLAISGVILYSYAKSLAEGGGNIKKEGVEEKETETLFDSVQKVLDTEQGLRTPKKSSSKKQIYDKDIRQQVPEKRTLLQRSSSNKYRD